MSKLSLLRTSALGALVSGSFFAARGTVAAQEDIAAAGNGGTADGSANGGAVAAGDVNSGDNVGNAIGTGDTGGADIYGGDVANATSLDVSVLGGTGIADASGGDYNIAFVS
ncbi:MAG: hypothetical protein H0V24_03110 [Chloroflexia bacterium]|nr:hypothetical protein [Chloroflexia bacterium]